MNTVIYLSDGEVRAAVFRKKGRKLETDVVYREKVPEYMIVNGEVIQEREFTEFLKCFWKKHGLSRRKVTLVIDSTRTVIKTIVIPSMSHRRIMEYLPREFASIDRGKTPVYTYHAFQEQTGKLRVLAAMAEQSFLEQHIRRLKGLGISVSAVSVGILVNVAWLSRLPQIQGKTCVVQILDGRNLSSILFVKGSYCYFTNTKAFGNRGTLDFGREIDLAVRVIRQFLEVQNSGEMISHVFLGAGFSLDDLKICQEIGGYTKNGTELLLLEQKDSCLLEMSAVLKKAGFGNQRNLLCQYRRSLEASRRCRELVHCLAPAGVLTGVLTMAAILQGIVWFSLSLQADKLMEQTDRLEVMEQAAAYDRLSAEYETINASLSAARQGLRQIHSYPVYTSDVRERLESCSREGMTIQMDHYDGDSGAVSVYVTAANAGDIAPYVDCLEQETEVFASVSYTGFQYDSEEQIWKSHIVCYLALPDDEAEEAESVGEAESAEEAGLAEDVEAKEVLP